MPTPLELPVDVDEVAEAMDVTTRDTIEFFLDMQSGAVVITGDGGVDEEIDVDDDRYRYIPPRETFENYELMRDFIATLDDRGFAERLWDAIQGAGAFGRFKRELSKQATAQARWYEFRDAALRRDAMHWLRSLNIQPASPPPDTLGHPE